MSPTNAYELSVSATIPSASTPASMLPMDVAPPSERPSMLDSALESAVKAAVKAEEIMSNQSGVASALFLQISSDGV